MQRSLQQPFRTLMISIPNQSRFNQSTTRLTHDQFIDHTSEEILTTKRPLLRVSNQVVKEQRQSKPSAGRSDAGGILPRSHQSVKLLKQETDTILNLPGNARYFPTVIQKTNVGEPSVRRNRLMNLSKFFTRQARLPPSPTSSICRMQAYGSGDSVRTAASGNPHTLCDVTAEQVDDVPRSCWSTSGY